MLPSTHVMVLQGKLKDANSFRKAVVGNIRSVALSCVNISVVAARVNHVCTLDEPAIVVRLFYAVLGLGWAVQALGCYVV